ncbi:hypothetical protein BRADI_3g40750v3 [Brachypodium distachyon]|uniref:BTB domain-containing protein n=1 Tax=Brachypodium distachyon TaxID=15368 RepID=A0A2K2D2G5_BRADI|nr:hypothetical protein BRADI_3g40750v3 [Brachypodium distachyon]
MRTTIVCSSVLKLTIDYEKAKQLPIGKYVESDVVSVGGHLWRIDCYPRGHSEDDKGEYLSLFLAPVNMSNTRSANAILDVFLMDKDGKPSATDARRLLHAFEVNSDGYSWGWPKFVKGTNLEKDYVAEGHITIVCTIMVTDERPIPVPPSDIGTHLGSLLDHNDRADVTFIVEDQTFHAHRAFLAARSRVFKEELLAPWLRLQCLPLSGTTLHLLHSNVCFTSSTQTTCREMTSLGALLSRCFRISLPRQTATH